MKGGPMAKHPVTAFFALLLSMWEGQEVSYLGDPTANLYFPIFDSFNETTQKTVGVLHAIIKWETYFRGILPPNINGIIAVLENSCDGAFTYELNGQDKRASPIGFGDHHDAKFDKWERKTIFNKGRTNIKDGSSSGVAFDDQTCSYSLRVYPSQRFENGHNTTAPRVISCAVAGVFCFAILMFLFYDR